MRNDEQGGPGRRRPPGPRRRRPQLRSQPGRPEVGPDAEAVRRPRRPTRRTRAGGRAASVRCRIRARSSEVTTTSTSRSSATVPSPSQSGRYDAPTHGHERLPPADVDVGVDDRRGDVEHEQHDRPQREVAVQRLADEPRERSARLAPVASTPSTAVTVSRARTTRPVLRLRYHSVGPCRSVAHAARSSSARPAAGADHASRRRRRAARRTSWLEQPAGSVVAEHDRRRAGGVGRDGGAAGTGHRATRPRGRARRCAGRAGGGTTAPAAAPATHAGARGGQAARARARPSTPGSPGRSETATSHGSPSGREIARSPPTLTRALPRSSPARVAATRSAAKALPVAPRSSAVPCRDPDRVVAEPDLPPGVEAPGRSDRRRAAGVDQPARSRGRSPGRRGAGPGAGARARSVSRAASTATVTAATSSGSTATQRPAAGVDPGQVGVGAEPAARAVNRGQDQRGQASRPSASSHGSRVATKT